VSPKFAELAWQRAQTTKAEAAARIAAEAREALEAPLRAITDTYALSAAVTAGPEVRVGDYLIPTDSTDAEAGTTVDLPDDEPDPFDYYAELRAEMGAER